MRPLGLCFHLLECKPMSFSSLPVSTLGVPRIGPHRELKSALESYWSGASDADALQKTATALRAANWARQYGLGVTVIPSNDFSLYDHVLDTTVMVGAIPEHYGWTGGKVSLDTYFAMARGNASVPALEMTKWFDTNYHFMVPELHRDQQFSLTSSKPLDEYLEARALGLETRPVLLGPVTFLTLSKSRDGNFDPISLIDRLLPVYIEILSQLHDAGAEWVQMDEPCLVLDLDTVTKAALRHAYYTLQQALPSLNIMLTTYFGSIVDMLDTVRTLPVAGLHLDLVRAPEQLDHVLSAMHSHQVLSLGVIDGRNIWRTDLAAKLNQLERVVAKLGKDRVQIATSCSMLHVPVDLQAEADLDSEVRQWLAFSVQKMEELTTLGLALANGRDVVSHALAASSDAASHRRSSRKVHSESVQSRIVSLSPEMAKRQVPFSTRAQEQRAALKLNLFPTTTIGSFPQTDAVRKARADHAKQRISTEEYTAFLRQETEQAIRWQEETGIDVLVHGEFERNDMVQYFGEQLNGYAFTTHGWVQSYGSRYVRPPIIFGDVSRPHAMTVDWACYAQSLTERPVKGMLTGPVTMLQWSFVRDDIPREKVCQQIALALRDEVSDLEAAGIKIIQIDEPAFREGLPLKTSEWQHYLDWAVSCFRLSSSSVRNTTQIHTHMCYSEFNDIMDAIAAMDADVISIETSRSKMELLDVFTDFRYPNEIGPGVYDIHSPRVPSVTEMTDLLQKALRHLSPEQIWVNPDCGLKTRHWKEVRPALVNMVSAARALRNIFVQPAE
ncbi:5-methyltetrahydropteroyltriglutamate--homocysteine methyltransferase [Granulibacter bethesdensis]|nr:5-methyltetrahydropteroyltriglutamate--homocysteine methyltransferase [Granulibacter bethesdensis]